VWQGRSREEDDWSSQKLSLQAHQKGKRPQEREREVGNHKHRMASHLRSGWEQKETEGIYSTTKKEAVVKDGHCSTREKGGLRSRKRKKKKKLRTPCREEPGEGRENNLPGGFRLHNEKERWRLG